MKISEKTGKIIGFVVLAAFVIIALVEFLFTKNDNSDSITGLQTLKQAGPNFWIGAVLGSVGAGLMAYLFIKSYKKTLDSRNFWVFFIAAAVFVAIAFGKGCTDKANDGVTSEKGRPVPVQVDSSRVPAEDLLPKDSI